MMHGQRNIKLRFAVLLVPHPTVPAVPIKVPKRIFMF